MSGFFLYSGNRLEKLAQAAAGILSRPQPGDVASGRLEPETVIVPGRMMEGWFKLYLAREVGVAANLEFPFPQTFIEERVFAPLRARLVTPSAGPVGAAVRPADPGKTSFVSGDPWAPENLLWRIFFALAPERGELLPGDAELRRFLAAAGDELSRFQLARSLAELFSRYQVSRPDLLLAWERGENPLAEQAASVWQMELWLRLRREIAVLPLVALLEPFYGLLYPGSHPPMAEADRLLAELTRSLPRCLLLFGFAALPQLYRELFTALGRLIEVHLFHLNPCAEYWGDQFRQKGTAVEPHPLLAAWGRHGRAFFTGLAGGQTAASRELFQPAEGKHLLAHLQNSLLYLRPPAPVPDEIPALLTDRSLQLHRCHTRRREVEVVYDAILAALAEEPDLEPDDILVLAPDISLYQPFIEAVFGAGGGARPRLPCALPAPRGAAELPRVRALLAALALCGGPFSAGAVYDLFCQPPVCRRFGVAPEELDRLFFWLKCAGVNWGLDREHRRRLGEPEFAEHSLAWGLDRLLAGAALAGNRLRDGSGSAAGSGAAEPPLEPWPPRAGETDEFLPLPGIEGDDTLLLGAFCAFVEVLRRFDLLFAAPLPAGEWPARLRELNQALLGPEKEAGEGGRQLNEAFARLESRLVAAVPTGESGGALRLESVRAWLEEEFAGAGGRGRLLGGVRFASLLEARALPAGVICLMGLNDGEFPRSAPPPAYDLIAAAPRPGDRRPREEDAYLFLETLLAARKRLILSYLGRDPVTNKTRPPASPVIELLEYIDDNFRLPPPAESAGLSSRLLLSDHALQPFSHRYFRDAAAAAGTGGKAGPLFTFSRTMAAIAAELARPGSGNASGSASGNGPAAEPGDAGKGLSEKTGSAGRGEECSGEVEAGGRAASGGAVPPAESAGGESRLSLSLDDLVRFFRNPSAWYCRRELALTVEPAAADSLAESEIFALDGLDNYSLRQELTGELLAVCAADAVSELDEAACERLEEQLLRRFRAAGRLPLGLVGRAHFREQFALVRAQVKRLRPWLRGLLPPYATTLRLPLAEGAVVELRLEFDRLCRGGEGEVVQLIYRSVKKGNHMDRLEFALRHLALEAVADELAAAGTAPSGSRFMALQADGDLFLARTLSENEAGARLARLAALFVAGRRRPLPFHPALSLDWHKRQGSKIAGGVESVDLPGVAEYLETYLNYKNNDYGEGPDAYFAHCFAGSLGDEACLTEFASLALEMVELMPFLQKDRK